MHAVVVKHLRGVKAKKKKKGRPSVRFDTLFYM
jgi:hypothetical protein